ncbi:hypothetical protein N431DRAFT_440683 [Stipitochalara longipes BDJ]|nr:hypothetical protein N431DRAFT_440683 [Stipitochalara longipes BDJ]
MKSPTEASNTSEVTTPIRASALTFQPQTSEVAMVMNKNTNLPVVSSVLRENPAEGSAIASSIDGSSSADAMARLSYDTGYGDFCFGRLVDRFHCSPLTGTQHDDSYWREGSNAIPVPELDFSEKSSPFPFFKLPRDIRDKIYLLLLRPLYTFNRKTKSRYIAMILSDGSHAYDDLGTYWGNFDEYLESQKAYDTLFARSDDFDGSDTEDEAMNDTQSEKLLSAEEYKVQKQQFYKEKERNIHYLKAHPNRGSPYKLIIIAFRNITKLWENNHDYLLIEWIRQASNVSTRFRAELGQLIWSNVEIRTNDNLGDMWHLPQFLDERPAASKAIRSVNIGLKMVYSDSSNWESEKFRTWCTEISQALEVEKLRFSITIDEENIHSLSRLHGQYSGLASSRSLRVTKKFEVKLCIRLSLSSMNMDDDAADDEYRENLEREHEPLITELMLPDTLRRLPTEVEEYLDSRPTEQPATTAEAPVSNQCISM